MKNVLSIFKSTAFWTVVAGTGVALVGFFIVYPAVKGWLAKKKAA